MHRVDDRSTSRVALLFAADETQPGRNSCPLLQFLSFSLDSILSLSLFVVMNLVSLLPFYILLTEKGTPLKYFQNWPVS